MSCRRKRRILTESIMRSNSLDLTIGASSIIFFSTSTTILRRVIRHGVNYTQRTVSQNFRMLYPLLMFDPIGQICRHIANAWSS